MQIKKTKLIDEIYLWALVLMFMVVLCAQFYLFPSLINDIEASNYFALVFSAIGLSALALPLAIKGKIRVGWGDIAVVGFFIYIVVNSYFNDSLNSKEFKMATAYFSIFFALKLIGEKYPNFVKHATIVIMLAGCYQSILVLLQLYGFNYSNHNRFAVTGSFYNPGPCGIFLASALVLAVAAIKNCQVKRSVLYITAYFTLLLTLLALFPTLSRAGWIGAAVAIALLYQKTIRGYFKSKLMRIVLAAIVLIVVAGVYIMKKDSADGRLFMWRNAISAFWELPITGVGVGNFAQSYSNAQYQYFFANNVLTQENKNIDMAGVPTSVFSEPLSLALMLGVVGVLFVGFICYKKAVSSTMFYVALSIFVASLFSYPFYIPVIGVVFVFAMASIQEKRQFYIPAYLYIPLLLLPLLNYGAFKEMEANSKWKSISKFYYSLKSYDTVCSVYPKLLPYFEKNYQFMFEYGHSLNKMELYEDSNEVLLKGVRYSTDPIFWTIIGNNYMNLGQYIKSEEAYLRAYYQCPSRLHPIYMLTKLFSVVPDREKTLYYGKIVLNKAPKIESPATTQMKNDVTKILNNE